MTQSIHAAHASPLDATPHHAAPAGRGQWMGYAVRVADKGASASLSVAEEIALAAAEKGGAEEVKRKKEEKGKESRRTGGAGDVDGAQEIMPGLPQHEAELFLRAVRQFNGAQSKSSGAAQQEGARQLLDLAGKFFRDPTLQHAALTFARQHLEGEKDICALLDAAQARLLETQGQAVRAGYNIREVEAPFSPQAARDCYRSEVLDYQSYERTFAALAKEFGPDEFPKAVTFLRKALGADMAALAPSTEAPRLHEVAEGLYMVLNLATLYADAGKLTAETAQRFDTTEPHPRKVMEALLHCKDDVNINEVSLRQQAGFCISKNPSRDAVFVRGLRELARALPLKLYPSPEQRLRLLHSMQDMLDKAIEREEEALS